MVVTEILRFTLDDKMMGKFYYDTTLILFRGFPCFPKSNFHRKLRVASCVFQACLSMTIITLSTATNDLGISSSIHSSNSMILRCISNAYVKSFFPSTKQTGSLWLILFRNSLTSMILVLMCERSMEVGLFLKTDKGAPAKTAKGFFSKRLFQNPKFCSISHCFSQKYVYLCTVMLGNSSVS